MKRKWARRLCLVLALVLLAGMLPLTEVRALGAGFGIEAAGRAAARVTAGQMAGQEDVIPDPGLKALANKELNRVLSGPARPLDRPITKEDAGVLEKLTIDLETGKDVKSLEGLQYAANLKELTIKKTVERDLDKIQHLPRLTVLEIWDNTVDLAWLGNHSQLEFLTLKNCDGFEDLMPLGSMPSLSQLRLLSCQSLRSLSGLSAAQDPKIDLLNCSECENLEDISGIKGLGELKRIWLDGFKITDANRQTTKDAISSLKNAELISMNRCDMTDEDTDMFCSLPKLQQLNLAENTIRDLAFAENLPKSLTWLGLESNEISNMDVLRKQPQLRWLGMSHNRVTDLRFLADMPALYTTGFGPGGGVFVETHVFNQKAATVGDGSTVVVENPFLIKNGSKEEPISFESVRPEDGAPYTVRYDAEKNQIIFENVPSGKDAQRVSASAIFTWINQWMAEPMKFTLYVQGDIGSYTVSYDWGTQAPEGQKLPKDDAIYLSQDAAIAAMDKTYTQETTLEGTKDGKTGMWKFSGWKVKTVDNTVKFTGSWRFTPNAYTVRYEWGNAPEGQKLPKDDATYATEQAAKDAMDKTYTGETTLRGTQNGKAGLWMFSGWTAKTEGKVVKFTGSWSFIADAYRVRYDWSNAPEGQTLPQDDGIYNTVKEALAAVDKTYTRETSVEGIQDGRKGHWHFSGWKAQVDGKTVAFTGSWNFVVERYTVEYEWGTAPKGQRLPKDKTVYDTPEEALAAMDKKYTAQTVVKGTQDDKKGVWQFSGWTGEADGSVIRFKGAWTFTADAYRVRYEWGSAPEGQTLPQDDTVYNTIQEAKAAVDKTYTYETRVEDTQDGKKGCWQFSGWSAELVDGEILYSGSWSFVTYEIRVKYLWSNAPEGQIRPQDDTIYNSVEEAKAAMDSTFTDKTTVKGTKNGQKGTWTFSGWTAKEEENTVKFVGGWTFAPKEEPAVTPTEPQKPETTPPSEPPKEPQKPQQPGTTPPAEKPQTPQTGDPILQAAALVLTSGALLSLAAFERARGRKRG